MPWLLVFNMYSSPYVSRTYQSPRWQKLDRRYSIIHCSTFGLVYDLCDDGCGNAPLNQATCGGFVSFLATNRCRHGGLGEAGIMKTDKAVMVINKGCWPAGLPNVTTSRYNSSTAWELLSHVISVRHHIGQYTRDEAYTTVVPWVVWLNEFYEDAQNLIYTIVHSGLGKDGIILYLTNIFHSPFPNPAKTVQNLRSMRS